MGDDVKYNSETAQIEEGRRWHIKTESKQNSEREIKRAEKKKTTTQRARN